MNASSLDQLQSWFAEALVHDSAIDAPVLASIVERGSLRASERLRIYQEAFWIRMRENLEEDYPALRRLIGGGRFTELVRQFIIASPQAHPSLIRLGEQLPRYLETRFPDRLELAAVARIEWAKIEVRHAEAPAVMLGALPALAPEVLFRIRLVPSSTSRLLELPCRAGRWMTSSTADSAEIESGRETVMVVRRGFEVFVEPIDDLFAPVLSRLAQGGTLADAVGLLESVAVGPDAVTDAFATFLKQGYFERFDL